MHMQWASLTRQDTHEKAQPLHRRLRHHQLVGEVLLDQNVLKQELGTTSLQQ